MPLNPGDDFPVGLLLLTGWSSCRRPIHFCAGDYRGNRPGGLVLPREEPEKHLKILVGNTG